jgi:hypothetical protein
MTELGFNLRGLIHYGLPNPVRRIEFSQASHVDETLAAIRDCGGSIVRVYVGNSNIDAVDTAARLAQFLDKAQQPQHGIKVIACLLDYYLPRGEGSWFTPQNIPQFYTIPIPPPSQADPWGDLLNEDFFNTEYRQDYLNFVRTVVDANKGHPGLYAWEPGNELQSNAITPFLKTVVKEIKDIDDRTRVAAGVLCAAHATGVEPSTAASRLYPEVRQIDYATVHYYPDHEPRDRQLPDVQWAVANDRRPIVEELGFLPGPNRPARIQAELDFWRGQGAEAILIWGFAVRSDGDDELITPNDADFSAIHEVFRAFAGV